jgi:hypothetical protein
VAGNAVTAVRHRLRPLTPNHADWSVFCLFVCISGFGAASICSKGERVVLSASWPCPPNKVVRHSGACRRNRSRLVFPGSCEVSRTRSDDPLSTMCCLQLIPRPRTGFGRTWDLDLTTGKAAAESVGVQPVKAYHSLAHQSTMYCFAERMRRLPLSAAGHRQAANREAALVRSRRTATRR